MQNDLVLSKKTRGILFNFKFCLQQIALTLQELVYISFATHKTKFKSAEFTELIKSVDDRLSYDQIDKVYQELNPEHADFIDSKFLTNILKKINEDDDPYKNELDIQSSKIITRSKIGKISENDEAILLLKQIKDKLKGLDPFQLLDMCDQNRDGFIEESQIEMLIFNLGISDDKKRKLIKKHLFRDNQKIEILQIINILGLRDVGKRVNFNQLNNRMSYKIEQPQKNKIRVSKIFDHKQKNNNFMRESMNNFVQIQQILGKYYNPESEMNQQLQTLAIKYIQSKTIYKDAHNPRSAKAARWQHASKLFKKQYQLFEVVQSILERQKSRVGIAQLFEAKDIIQGSLGDCYFLSAVAGVAQHYPQLMFRLFILDKNPASIYGIRLFIDGQWQTIITDAYFPVNQYNQYIYAKPHGNQIWVQLLQKAFAKVYGSYEDINSGLTEEGLRTLTGAPCLNFQTTDANCRQTIIFYLNKKKYILSTSGSKQLQKLNKNRQQALGLVPNHAYSILKLFQNVGAKKVTLIKLRNPWGNKQWLGDWSFNSNSWTKQLRNQFNYNKNPNDGTFYMNYDEFKYYFSHLSVCFIHLDKVNSNIKLNSDRRHSVMVKFIIKKAGDYYFSIYQQGKRKYLNSTNYSLSKSRMFIGRMKNGKVQAIAAKAEISSNLHIEVTLQPGEYLISSKIKWKFFQQHEFNLTSYGPQKVKFTQIPKIKQFIQGWIQSRSQLPYDKNNKYYKQDNYKNAQLSSAYRVMFTNLDQGYGYLIINNLSNKGFTSSIKFKQSKGLKVVKPQTFSNFLNMKVPAGSRIIKTFLLDPQGMQYNFQQSLII